MQTLSSTEQLIDLAQEKLTTLSAPEKLSTISAETTDKIEASLVMLRSVREQPDLGWQLHRLFLNTAISYLGQVCAELTAGSPENLKSCQEAQALAKQAIESGNLAAATLPTAETLTKAEPSPAPAAPPQLPALAVAPLAPPSPLAAVPTPQPPAPITQTAPPMRPAPVTTAKTADPRRTVFERLSSELEAPVLQALLGVLLSFGNSAPTPEALLGRLNHKNQSTNLPDLLRRLGRLKALNCLATLEITDKNFRLQVRPDLLKRKGGQHE